jgi:hypothetical protein
VKVIWNAIDFNTASFEVSDDAADVFVDLSFDWLIDERFAIFRAEDDVVVEFCVCSRHREFPLANSYVAAARLCVHGLTFPGVYTPG